MIAILQTLALLILAQAIPKNNILNFTYYYQHSYSPPPHIQVVLEFHREGPNLTELFTSFYSSYKAVSESATLHNALIVNKPQLAIPQSIQIVRDSFRLQSSIVVETENQSSLSDLLDSLLNISQNHSIKLGSIQRRSTKNIHLMQQEINIHKGAQVRSQAICRKYFNMKLQKISLFQKVQSNQTNNQTDNTSFVGDLYEAKEEIQNRKAISDIEVNSFFKCQIICRQSGQHSQPKPKQQRSTEQWLSKLDKQKKGKQKTKASKQPKAKKPKKARQQQL